ncbi:hypothetical protein [Rubellimicrobium sp. CFH 75288]|uniref:hypothetical protein n=1 Tax=Rubellimicrobium sp. CFH 75288 TaxID=2697034 RepID=UPI001412CFFD|nr:hypothetical protein [Rubellimicrobium sp. CFH 75288]NAZ38155.1 hypothetical protein [Rubellimicrobium sp. CFH 75288]
MEGFATLQAGLGRALAAPARGWPHVAVILPSLSFGEAVIAHYGHRLPALEHRALAAFWRLAREPLAEVVFVSTWEPSEAVMDLLGRLVPDGPGLRARFHPVAVGEGGTRPLAWKLLERPDLLARIRGLIGGRPALLEPWTVTEAEARLALALGVPVDGAAPDLWPLGFKGAGRRLLREAGVPVLPGAEGIADPEGALEACRDLAARGVRAAVVKLDDGAAGEGNRIVDLCDPEGLEPRLLSFGADFWDEMRTGGVVEARLEGEDFASPSVQIDLRPGGRVDVAATHEQVLGGEEGQVYLGCRFPAEPAHAPALGRMGLAVGEVLARRGALGRAAVDFVSVRRADGGRALYGIEINLRRGGTTHTLETLRGLAPGAYDAEAGIWRARAGGTRVYAASDNLENPGWVGLGESEAVRRLGAAGLLFDGCEGVAPLALAGLGIDGRLSAVAIATRRERAEALLAAVPRALGAASG